MKLWMEKWQWIGFVVTGVLGVILHYLFDWTGEHPAAALISAVNESTWEHMKLLFYGLLFFALAERLLQKEPRSDFWAVKLKGTLLGLSLIPVLFYTYTGILGRSLDWLNIAIFYIAAAAAYLWETREVRRQETGTSGRKQRCRLQENTAVMALWILAALFTVFTFLPPELSLFRDPLTGMYGYKG